MSPNIELAKPRDFGEIISDTFTFIKENFKPLLKYFFIFCGLFLIFSAASMILIQIKAFNFYDSSYDPNAFDDSNAFSRVFSMIGGLLVYAVFMVLQYVALNVTVFCFMTLYRQKQNTLPTTEEMWGYIKYYYLKILGSNILLYILLIIGFMFCLVPGIYLSPIFALVTPIMIAENTSFGYAFNQSFKLIKDNWWSTFGVFVVIYIILYVINLIVSVPSMILGAGNVFLHLTKNSQALSLPIAIITTLLQSVSYFFHMLMVVAVGVVYFSLTESKEGTGLMERINQFGTDAPTHGPEPEEY